MSYRKRWLRKSSLVPVSVLIPWSSVHRFIDVDDNRSSSRELRFRIACSEDGIELLAKFQNLFFPCGVKAMDDFAFVFHGRLRREFPRPLPLEVLECDTRVDREILHHRLAGLQGRSLAKVLYFLQEFRMFLAISRECRQADAGVSDRFRFRRVEAECVPEPLEDGAVNFKSRASRSRAVRADWAFLTRQTAEWSLAMVLTLHGAMGAVERIGVPAAGKEFLNGVSHNLAAGVRLRVFYIGSNCPDLNLPDLKPGRSTVRRLAVFTMSRVSSHMSLMPRRWRLACLKSFLTSPQPYVRAKSLRVRPQGWTVSRR